MSTLREAAQALCDHLDAPGCARWNRILNQLIAETRAELAKPDAPAGAPDGWQLVPVEPTQAMCQEGQWKAQEWPKFPLRISPIYQAMLAAAPRPAPAEPQASLAQDYIAASVAKQMAPMYAAFAPAPQPAGGGREPVAVIYRAHYGGRVRNIGFNSIRELRSLDAIPVGTKLYTNPPAAEPLTDEQVFASEDFMTANGLYWGLPMTTLIQIVRCTERALGITGSAVDAGSRG